MTYHRVVHPIDRTGKLRYEVIYIHECMLPGVPFETHIRVGAFERPDMALKCVESDLVTHSTHCYGYDTVERRIVDAPAL